MPSNFHDGYNPDWADESISISYGRGVGTGISQKARYYIVNYHDGPFPQNGDSLLQYNAANPNSVLAICNWNSWERITRLESSFGPANVEWVQGPFIPHTVDNANNFGKPVLLWSFRNFWHWAETDPAGMTTLFAQIDRYFQYDDSIRLYIIDHRRPHQKDYSIREYLSNHGLKHQLDRVVILNDLGWSQILALLQDTKMIICPSESLGCPAYEAAMYGIPTILDVKENPFQDPTGKRFFPDLLVAPRSFNKQFFDLLDRLFYDRSFYRQYGDAYRNYAREHVTYDAFYKQLKIITEKRNWV
jgi:hypothetical protein